jgi:plastocyanin
MVALEGSSYVPPIFSWKHPVAVTAVELVTSTGLGDSSANTAWFGTVLSDVLLRYPMAEDGSGLQLDGPLGDGVDDNSQKGDLGESADFVVGTGFGIVTDIGLGPDDLLYVSSITSGTVYRIGPADRVGGNEPPPAASAAPSEGTGGEAEQLTIGTDTGTALLFDPTTATVPAGSSVQLTFENRSTVPHNLTLGEPINEATATIVDPGASEALEFTAPDPGDYKYVCTVHPGMTGSVSVSDSAAP